MKHHYYHHQKFPHLQKREHHPRISVGIFFIVLGVALLVATNDLLDLGSVKDYFTWQTAMIFVGVLLILNLNFTGGVLLIAAGIWFLKDQIYLMSPEAFNTFYWPVVIGLIGLAFILSSLFKNKPKVNS
jgi:hypothetical protein